MSNDTPPNDQGKPREGFPFKLNGEKLFAPLEKMRAHEILEIAWEMKILPFEPGKYKLVSSKDGSVYKADDIRRSCSGLRLYCPAHSTDARRPGIVCHRPSIKSRSNFKNSDCQPPVFTSPHGEVVAFSYVIDVGRLSGAGCQLGFSMQEPGFPVYAPHWIHISPPVDDKQGSGRHYSDEQSTPWVAFSRPPTYWTICRPRA